MKNKIKIDIGNATSKLILLCWMTIIACTILKFFGYKEFEIPIISKIELHHIIRKIINCIFYCLNGICFVLILIKRKLNLKEFLIVLIVNIILFIISMFPKLNILVLILEFSSYAFIGMLLIKDKLYKSIIESFVILIIFSIYQILTMLYKNINIGIKPVDFISNLCLEVDYYAFVLLTIIREFKKGGYIYGRWQTILAILSKRKCYKEVVRQDQDKVSQEVGYKLFLIVLSIAQIFLVGTICYFVNNVILEYFIIIVSFFVMRQVFGKSYHADSVLACTTLSVIVFTIATRLPLPQWLSILCNVFIGCMVAYVMYMWYYYAQYVTKEEIVIRSGMKREDLIYLCERANLTKLATDRMLLKYVEGKSTKEIAVIEGVELESIKSSIRRSRKAIQS